MIEIAEARADLIQGGNFLQMAQQIGIPIKAMTANTNANTAGPQNCIRARFSLLNRHTPFARKDTRPQHLSPSPSTTPISTISPVISVTQEVAGSSPVVPAILANKHGGIMSASSGIFAAANKVPTQMPTRTGS